MPLISLCRLPSRRLWPAHIFLYHCLGFAKIYKSINWLFCVRSDRLHCFSQTIYDRCVFFESNLTAFYSMFYFWSKSDIRNVQMRCVSWDRGLGTEFPEFDGPVLLPIFTWCENAWMWNDGESLIQLGMGSICVWFTFMVFLSDIANVVIGLDQQ